MSIMHNIIHTQPCAHTFAGRAGSFFFFFAIIIILKKNPKKRRERNLKNDISLRFLPHLCLYGLDISFRVLAAVFESFFCRRELNFFHSNFKLLWILSKNAVLFFH